MRDVFTPACPPKNCGSGRGSYLKSEKLSHVHVAQESRIELILESLEVMESFIMDIRCVERALLGAASLN